MTQCITPCWLNGCRSLIRNIRSMCSVCVYNMYTYIHTYIHTYGVCLASILVHQVRNCPYKEPSKFRVAKRTRRQPLSVSSLAAGPASLVVSGWMEPWNG
ncbi:hypothetical protein LZ32DRAFT_334117 [Colletotrichum eremochloae]|nr:hypothetical protein LZ32DRAFT_334117 [Colletotrichum eremochloae]